MVVGQTLVPAAGCESMGTKVRSSSCSNHSSDCMDAGHGVVHAVACVAHADQRLTPLLCLSSSHGCVKLYAADLLAEGLAGQLKAAMAVSLYRVNPWNPGAHKGNPVDSDLVPGCVRISGKD